LEEINEIQPATNVTHVHVLSLSESLGVIPGMVAAGVSYYFNKSVLWALLHFVLSYAYLTYKALDVLLSGKV